MNRVSILLLEDSSLDAELVRSWLERNGLEFDLTRVVTRSEFVGALESGCSFDVILSDFALPDFDGMSALDLVRAKWPQCPFVFVSGALGEERAVECLHRGATDYVLKQRPQRLGSVVRRALRERRAREDLEKARALHRDCLEAAGIVAWEWEPVGDALVLSDNASSVLGLSPEDVPATGTALLHMVHTADRPRVASARRQAASTGRLAEGGTAYREEYRLVRPDGSLLWIDDRGQAIEGGVRGVILDATDRKRAEFALQEADRRKDEFLAMLAHELRNPVAAVRNAVTLLKLAGDEGNRAWAPTSSSASSII